MVHLVLGVNIQIHVSDLRPTRTLSASSFSYVRLLYLEAYDFRLFARKLVGKKYSKTREAVLKATNEVVTVEVIQSWR